MPPRPSPRSLPVVVLLTGLVAFAPMSTDFYLPSLPSIGRDLDASIATVQLTLSVFMVGFAVSQLVYGPLSDRFGRRPVILGGVALYTLASIACALAPTIEALIAARFVQAVGACAGPVLARAVVRDVFGREGAARVLAYMAMAMALAPAIGPIIGGYLTVWAGWRANFVVLTGFGALIVAGTALLLAETNAHRDPAATRPGRLAANYATLLGHRAYLGFVLVAAFTYSGIFSFISGSSFLFIEVVGLAPNVYGLCFAAVVVGYMIGSFAAGRISTRLGVERMIRLGTGISAAGGLAMVGCAAAGWLGVVPVVGPFAVFMIGAGLTLPNAMAGAVGPFPTMAGLASAFAGFVQMGLAAGVGIAVGAGTEAAFAAGWQATAGLPMAISVVLVALGMVAADRLLVRPRVPVQA
jgi:DHA1 family bicyclomycin/chloramphenicol resistance-like MFS transporter